MSSPLEEPLEKDPGQSLLVCSPNWQPSDHNADDEFDLFEYWNIIWGRRKFIFQFTGTCTLLAVLLTLYFLSVFFRSKAVFPR